MDKITKYAKKALREGTSPVKVRKILISAGWKKEEVDKALDKLLNSSGEYLEEKMSAGSDRGKLIALTLVVVIMITLLAGIFLGFFSLDPRMFF